MPVCDANYYRVLKGLLVRTYRCEHCPYYSTDIMIAIGTSPRGSTSVTKCYIQNGYTVVDDTGTATITGGNCYYEN